MRAVSRGVRAFGDYPARPNGRQGPRHSRRSLYKTSTASVYRAGDVAEAGSGKSLVRWVRLLGLPDPAPGSTVTGRSAVDSTMPQC